MIGQGEDLLDARRLSLDNNADLSVGNKVDCKPDNRVEIHPAHLREGC